MTRRRPGWRAIFLGLIAVLFTPVVLAAYALCSLGEYGDCDLRRPSELIVGLAASAVFLAAAVLSGFGHSRAALWGTILACALVLVWASLVTSF